MRNNGLLPYDTIVQATSGEPEVPFLHYLCKANQKKFCFIRRFWKTLYYPAKREMKSKNI